MSFDKEEVYRSGVSSRLAMGKLHNIVEKWALEDGSTIKRSCASCIFSVKKGPFKCSTYNAVPPIDVIMNGCDSYSDEDDIPF